MPYYREETSFYPCINVPEAAAVYGYESAFIENFPSLITDSEHHARARSNTKRWLSNPSKPLKRAWQVTQAFQNVEEWSNYRRKLFWENHIRSNNGLFEPEYLPKLAEVLDITVPDLKKIHTLSCDPKTVKRWSKNKLDEASRIADLAYLLSSLVRGKYHEYHARAASLQLIAHPHRQSIAVKTNEHIDIPVSYSEQFFVKVLVGSALLHHNAEQRIKAWSDNILKARNLIRLNAIILPQTVIPEDAERYACEAAKRLELPGTRPWQVAIGTWATGAAIGSVLAVILAPWTSIIGGVIPPVYKRVKGRQLGEDLAKIRGMRKYERLANSIPDRIDRALTSNKQ